MLEDTDAKIHFIYYTPEMELLRADSGLRTNSFLRLRKLVANAKPVLHVQDLGYPERALKNRALVGENARALLKRGIIPTEDSWGGTASQRPRGVRLFGPSPYHCLLCTMITYPFL